MQSVYFLFIHFIKILFPQEITIRNINSPQKMKKNMGKLLMKPNTETCGLIEPNIYLLYTTRHID